MGNENVEFNEVRCKTLILGDEETGFINLKVSNIDNSPAIEINPNDGNEESSITLGFKNGRPTLILTSHDADQKENKICLSFNDQGMPTFEIVANFINEDDFDSGFAIGFSEGRPMLGLISNHDKHTSIASLLIDEKETTQLILSNERIKGGVLAMKAEDDGASIIIGNYRDIIEAADSQKKSNSILIVNNSDITLMDIKGQTIGGRNIPKKKNFSKGENNE